MTLLHSEPEWAAAASLDDWHTNFLCVGPIARDRNLNFLLAAMTKYRKAHDPFARLILAGPTPDAGYLQELRAAVHSLGLDGSVLVVNAGNTARMRALHLAADAVLAIGQADCSDAEAMNVRVIRTAETGTPKRLAYAMA